MSLVQHVRGIKPKTVYVSPYGSKVSTLCNNVDLATNLGNGDRIFDGIYDLLICVVSIGTGWHRGKNLSNNSAKPIIVFGGSSLSLRFFSVLKKFTNFFVDHAAIKSEIFSTSGRHAARL